MDEDLAIASAKLGERYDGVQALPVGLKVGTVLSVALKNLTRKFEYTVELLANVLGVSK